MMRLLRCSSPTLWTCTSCSSSGSLLATDYFLTTCSLLKLHLFPACLLVDHLYALLVSPWKLVPFAAAGRRSVVSTAESCLEHTNIRRITLIVAWWGPGIRAEPGPPGLGPCRTAPRLKPQPNTLAATETAPSAHPGLLQAGPGLRAKPSHTALQDVSPPQAHEERFSSDSVATSAAESDSVSALESAANSSSASNSNTPPESSAPTDTEPSYSQLLWLQQCQLPSHQQQAFNCPPQEDHTPGTSRLGDSAGDGDPSQPGKSSTTLVPRREAHGTNGSQGLCHRYSSAKGYSDVTSTVLPSAKGYHPPTISPVWLPVSALRQEEHCDEEDSQQGDQQNGERDHLPVDQQNYSQGSWQHSQQDHQQDDQQDDQQDAEQDGKLDGQYNEEDSGQDVRPVQQGSQPAAKRHKRDQCNHRDTAPDQQQLDLPLPPLRFFLRSANEISSVYLPRIPTAVSDEL